MSKLAPVMISTYTRIDHLKQTIEALKKNYLAKETDLFVVSDGAKNDIDKIAVSKVRNYIDDVTGFRSVNRIYHPVNIGVYKSVLLIEPQLFSDYGRLISMEDDIVTSKNFLDFINSGLNFFEAADHIHSVSGYCHPIDLSSVKNFDSWLIPWFCPWGFGTWKKKYDKININHNPIDEIKKNFNLNRFLEKYGNFFVESLEQDKSGIRVVPDARICAQMLLFGMAAVMPSISKVKNIGLDGSGVNCPVTNRYDVNLDDGNKRFFLFDNGLLDVNRIEVVLYHKFMNGSAVDTFKRDFLRSLRKITWLKKLKKKILK